MILASFAGSRRHSKNPQASYFSGQSLVRNLQTERYQQLLRPFFSFNEGNVGYSRKYGETKAYTLLPHVVTALDRMMETRSQLIVVPVFADAATGMERTRGDLRKNGIPEPLSEKLFVPSVFALSEANVLSAIDKVQQRLATYGDSSLNPKKPAGNTLLQGLRQLQQCDLWRRSLGGLPNLYVEQTSGRLGYEGLSPHLISMPSMLRALLLEKTDLVSFDISASYYSIYVSVGKSIGIFTSHAEAYLKNRSAYHGAWSRATGHDNPDSFKRVAISWLMGATLSHSRRTSSTKVFGKDAMMKLSQDQSARLLYKEVRTGMKEIIRAHSKNNVIVNVLGKELQLDDRSNDFTNFGKSASHILVGYEQYAIREICQKVEGLKAIIYDAFVAAPQSVEPLEEFIREKSRKELGVALEINLTATRFADLLPSVSAEPTDF